MTFLAAILSTSEIVLRSASFTCAGSPASMAAADVAQRAAETSSHLPIPVALDDILTVRFERRGMTCQ